MPSPVLHKHCAVCLFPAGSTTVILVQTNTSSMLAESLEKEINIILMWNSLQETMSIL